MHRISATTQACHGEQGVSRCMRGARAAEAVSTPPMNPSIVFFGLSVGAMGRLPQSLPQMYCRTSLP